MGFVKRNQSILDAPCATENDTSTVAEKTPADWMNDLQQGSSEVRRYAAAALVGQPECLSTLVGHLMRETDLAVRTTLFSTLIQTPGAETARLLAGLLRSEDANLRNEAIEALASMPDAVEPLMESMIHDPDSDVRIFAVNIMASVKHYKVVDWLVEIVANDLETNVCATAVDLMAEVGDERCLPALEIASQRFADEPYLEFVIDLAQARITNQASEPRDYV